MQWDLPLPGDDHRPGERAGHHQVCGVHPCPPGRQDQGGTRLGQLLHSLFLSVTPHPLLPCPHSLPPSQPLTPTSLSHLFSCYLFLLPLFSCLLFSSLLFFCSFLFFSFLSVFLFLRLTVCKEPVIYLSISLSRLFCYRIVCLSFLVFFSLVFFCFVLSFSLLFSLSLSLYFSGWLSLKSQLSIYLSFSSLLLLSFYSPLISCLLLLLLLWNTFPQW